METYATLIDEIMEVPSQIRQAAGLGQQLNRLPLGFAADVQGMGTWRLKGRGARQQGVLGAHAG